jgi:dTDP-glucose 4,6-dehydratase
MLKKLSKILVTGGAGFIGSEFVRQGVAKGQRIVIIDKLTYAGDLDRLECVKGKYKFYKTDICDKKAIEKIFKKEQPAAIVHFAAESHVDRSIEDASPFIETNIKGTQVILDVCRKYRIKKLVSISTDEVYGEIKRGQFTEASPIQPNSPYSAAKAAADLLVRAYIRTYGLPAVIARPCNNYGPWQFPEKLIPVITLNALNNKKVPVYAKGENVREWLHVSDCAKAIFLILERGRCGEVYNIGSSKECKNIDTVKTILKILKKPESLIEFVKDRAGHDFRYSLNCNKLKKELGWSPKVRFEDGLKETVNWFINSKYNCSH